MTRHAPDPRVTTTCEACGLSFTTPHRGPARPTARYCSLYCRDYTRHGQPWACELPKHHPARGHIAPPPNPEPARPGWIVGICHECGAPFTAPNDGQRHLLCSTRCIKRIARHRRRAREHNAPGSFRYVEVMRLYMADDKRCAYCRQPIDRLPDPEHVTPLSRGGRNDLTNLVAACRPCNTDKNDLTLDEWTADRARRGLPPVDTDLTAPRFRHLVIRQPTGPAWRHAGV